MIRMSEILSFLLISLLFVWKGFLSSRKTLPSAGPRYPLAVGPNRTSVAQAPNGLPAATANYLDIYIIAANTKQKTEKWKIIDIEMRSLLGPKKLGNDNIWYICIYWISEYLICNYFVSYF